MRVYCIRHGQSVANLENRVAGWTQIPLTELGLQQASAIAPFLSRIRFDRVYSSDLRRAIQTAKNAIPGCEPIQTPFLREISLGTLCGPTKTELYAMYGEKFHEAMRNRDYTAFDGETAEMIYERVAVFMRRLETLEGVENVAAFGHMGTVHAMIEYVLKAVFPLANLATPNCGVTVFAFENGKWKLESLDIASKLS